jgi:hypothetical protein
MIHFEELWQKCEDHHIKNNDDENLPIIIDELIIILNLLKVINLKSEISKQDKEASKQQLLGTVLFLLTKISVKENINVFKALMQTLLER